MAQDSTLICHKKSTHWMKIPLKSTEQIYLVFLIPALINCIIYIIHFSADFVVAIQHFKEENSIWGYCTIAIMYTPALSYFVLTVSRPDWWMTDDDKVSKGILGWFGLQVCQLIGFMFFVLYRYAGLIVLSIDAIILSGDARIKTLNIAAAPAAIELYFFLQAWFQAAPQAILQAHLLFRQSSTEHSYQTVIIQVLCIVMSVAIMAIVTASFQRFESQRINGRKLPWAMWLKRYCVQELDKSEEKLSLQVKMEENEVNLSKSIQENKQEENVVSENEDEFRSESHTFLNRQISVTPPLPPKNAHVTPPPTPLRGITTVTSLPVPDAPAPPRPDSIYEASQQKMTGSVPILDSNQRLIDNARSLKVPKRKYSEKGLEEDDPVGKVLSFIWWFFFILARVLAIIVAYEFYPAYLIAVLSIHYAIMLIYLFCYAKYYDAITFFVNLWLGMVYIFSLIEYRIKFKYADKWLLPYYIFVIIQNAALTLTWYFHADWNGFWYTYIFYVIFTSMALCVSSSIMYHVLFKPKKCRIYNS